MSLSRRRRRLLRLLPMKPCCPPIFGRRMRPLPVILNRFAAARFVFIFAMRVFSFAAPAVLLMNRTASFESDSAAKVRLLKKQDSQFRIRHRVAGTRSEPERWGDATYDQPAGARQVDFARSLLRQPRKCCSNGRKFQLSWSGCASPAPLGASAGDSVWEPLLCR